MSGIGKGPWRIGPARCDFYGPIVSRALQLNVSRLYSSSGGSEESSVLLTQQRHWHNGQDQNLPEFRRCPCQAVCLRTVLMLFLLHFNNYPSNSWWWWKAALWSESLTYTSNDRLFPLPFTFHYVFPHQPAIICLFSLEKHWILITAEGGVRPGWM